MPSPKAVLHDIAAQGLDPKRAYTRTSASGKLAVGPTKKLEAPKMALKQLEEKPTVKVEKMPEPVKVELPKEEEKVVVEPVKVETAVVASEPPKPSKAAKPKVEKKEAPKVETVEAEKKLDEADKV